MATTVWDLIKQEHQNVNTLEEVFTAIADELQVHAELEETIIYPLLADHDGDLAQHAEEEHNQVRDIIEIMEDLTPEDEEFMSQMKQLEQAVKKHISEEETKIIPLLQSQLDDNEAAG